jgi:hypothetical protein
MLLDHRDVHLNYYRYRCKELSNYIKIRLIGNVNISYASNVQMIL